MLLKLLLHCFVFCFITAVNCENHWRLEEVQVLNAAQEENRPIIAVFLGASCPWSKKLVQEVLENPQFIEKIRPEAILWIVPLIQKEEVKILLQKYGIKNCPVILLLDPKGKEFARSEYVPLDASGYAEMMIEHINNFQEICLSLDQGKGNYEEGKWQELYQKAKKLSANCFKQVILEQGLHYEEGVYFHLEKYAALLEKLKLKHPQVIKAKKQLLDRDPENELGTHFQVAVLEFQKKASYLKSKIRPEKALKPLIRYIQKFGKKDPENYWKSELLIAEFLFTKNAFALALEHAETAYSEAPEFFKPQVLETISLIKRNYKK